jgi:hypothetical protein
MQYDKLRYTRYNNTTPRPGIWTLIREGVANAARLVLAPHRTTTHVRTRSQPRNWPTGEATDNPPEDDPPPN